jgi:hypothetical protein
MVRAHVGDGRHLSQCDAFIETLAYSADHPLDRSCVKFNRVNSFWLQIG